MGAYMTEVIDCEPTWSRLIQGYLTILEYGDTPQRETVRAEIKKMASICDAYKLLQSGLQIKNERQKDDFEMIDALKKVVQYADLNIYNAPTLEKPIKIIVAYMGKWYPKKQ